MVTALVFLGGLGAASALLLGIASRVFYVKEDPRIAAVEAALPGANCGGCGYAGCRACAEVIVQGRAPCNVCVAGGYETAVEVGAVMGVAVEAKEPELASTSCSYGLADADTIFAYSGAQDCQAAVALFGGSKLCPIGCIGLGSCVKACQFDALSMGADHLPVFNPKKCVACGACVDACPKGIIALTSATRRIQAEYSTDECTAPCQRGCPTGIDIPSYIRAIRHGEFAGAVRIIKEKCPLPLVCGRICPAPCESECRRLLVPDEAVSINALKRFVADYEVETGEHINPYRAPDSGRRVAVIGAGAEGLTAAYYLARLGHAATLYEAKERLGGILSHVISPGRLPEAVLTHEIEGILAMGVTARTGQALGRDFTLDQLFTEGADAVLLATGGYDSRKILAPGPGSERLVPGVQTVVHFLEADAAGQAAPLGRRVMIAGEVEDLAGLAEICRRHGAEEITLVTGPDEARPTPDRDAAGAAVDGVTLRRATTLAGLWGRGEALTGATLESREGRDGEPALTMVDIDALLLVTGRVPEWCLVPLRETPDAPEGGEAEEAVYRGEWRTVEIYRTFPGAARQGLLTPPEPGRMSDASAVVRAILSGRRMARGLQYHLSGSTIVPVEHLAAAADDVLNVDAIDSVTASRRQEASGLPPEPSTEGDWMQGAERPGLTAEQARREAERCLQCGLICYRKAI